MFLAPVGLILIALGFLWALESSQAGGAALLVLGAVAVLWGALRGRREAAQLRADGLAQARVRDDLAAQLAAGAAARVQWERALAAAGDIVLALDQDARLQYLNPSAQAMLEAGAEPPRPLLGAPLLGAVEDPDLYEAARAAIHEQTPSVLIVRRAERRFRAVVAPLPGPAAGPWAAVLAMHDLSDLYEAEQARRDFFINASHELRTPLASIAAAAETLALVQQPADAQRFRQIIQSEAERMSQLIEEMLALARLESGLTEPQMEVVGLESLLAAAAESIRPQAEREGLQLRCLVEAGEDETQVAADPELVERALLNLLHNAVKFTAAGGEIEVRAEAAEGEEEEASPMVWIRVRDTGIGIAAAEQARIFQRFYRVDRARSGGGTGLGLAVVRHIAEAHGGSVQLESEAGAGSTFSFSIPRALS